MSGYLKFMVSVLTLLAFSGCLFDGGGDTITGQYNVCWIDLPSNRSINMSDKDGGQGGIQILPPYIYAVGHNKRFIVAKQHPRNTKLTNYYIIDMTKDNLYWQKGVYGPFTKVQYDSACQAMEVGAIDFDMIYTENP